MGARAIRVLMGGTLLLLDLLILRTQVSTMIGSAACVERANWELISCVAPPPQWEMLLTSMLALVLSAIIGAIVAGGRSRTA